MKCFSFVFILIFLLSGISLAYQLRIDPQDLQISTTKVPNFGAFSELELKGAYQLPVNPGDPKLPSKTVNLAVPTGMDIDSVQVNYSEPENLDGYYLIFPQQQPTTTDYDKPEFTPPNPKVYSSVRPFPGDLVWSFGSNNVSGYQMGSIAFAPVQYVPLTGQVIVYREIDFTVTYKPKRIQTRYPKVRLHWVDDLVREAVAANVINPDEITGPSARLLNGKDRTETYPYLILTNEDLEQKANDLAYWKTKKGLHARVITVEDIDNNYNGDDLQDKIRNCIIDYYENYSTIYVCIIDFRDETIGYGHLPMREVYNPTYDDLPELTMPTDNYYACLDGDWNANDNQYYGEWGQNNDDEVDFGYDVFIGRIRVDDSDELDIVNNKIACYEGTSLANETNPYDYQDNVILAGAWLSSGNDSAETTMKPIQNNYLTSQFWDITGLWDANFYPEGPGDVFNPQSFVTNMNAGVGIIAHGAHGGQNWIGTNYAIDIPYWGAKVENNNLASLENQPRYTGFLYSFSCSSANPHFAENCANSFICAPEGGGVGYIGSTYSGWLNYCCSFEKEFFHQLCSLDVFASGRTLAFSKDAFSSYVSNHYYLFEYYCNYLTGDPDIWVPNDTLPQLVITYDNSINTGTQDYSVNVIRRSSALEGALVCIWKGNEVYTSGETDSSGDITFYDIDPTTSGTMYLTVTAANSQTFEANVTVSSKAEIRLLSFNTKRNAKGVQLSWLVKSSFPIEGFNLYRRNIIPDSVSLNSLEKTKFKVGKVKKQSIEKAKTFSPQGKWEKVNDKPITGKNPYYYLDRTALGKEKYEYQLAVMNKKHVTLLHLDEDYLGTTSVAEVTETEAFQLKIAPNPAHTNIQLLLILHSAESNATIILYDLSGREISRWENLYFGTGENQFSIPVEELANGVYQMKLLGNSINTTRNIVVMH